MDQLGLAHAYGFMPHLSLAERWEQLKPVITQLYVNDNLKLSEVIERIEAQYGFYAVENQYKYHINRKWKLKKSIPTTKKTEMLRLIEDRAASGKSTQLTYQGKDVDKKKLRRLAKAQTRKTMGLVKIESIDRPGPVIHFAKRIFINWNMPYGALRASHARAVDHFSPEALVASASTPSDVVAVTPANTATLTPSADSPFSIVKALGVMHSVERAYLFVEGKHDELIALMHKQERITMATWLYQFWLFSFKTARHWGKGPRNWTAELMDLDKHLEKLSISSPNTPGANITSPAHHETPRSHLSPRIPPGSGETPTALCQWGIHLPGLEYEEIRSPPPEEDMEGKWADWPESWKRRSFKDILRENLENNDFSNVDADSLPVALPKVLRKAKRRHDELLVEALGFSIMGRNVDLLFDTVQQIAEAELNVDDVYPFHLATSYLSGSDPCCDVLCCLVYRPSLFSLRRLYLDDMGHTVLDNLMIAILKGHTDCLPGEVNDALKRERRFPGEEVDICGRWDADSDCVRELLARGECKIPLSWKHKFCHTSAQAICHCINILFGPRWRPDINNPSGLFVKRCTDCGGKLQLLPLHAMVMVAFQLAQRGCDGEDLFGIIACLLCVLRKGANPLLKAIIPLSALFGTEQQRKTCDHEALDPLELADWVTERWLLAWSEETMTGWRVFCLVLRLSREAWAPGSLNQKDAQRATPRGDPFDQFIQYDVDAMELDHNDESLPSIEAHEDEDAMSVDEEIPRDCEDCGAINYFHGNTDLRDLWAAAQAELLTYRRLKEGDCWTSPNFKLDEILQNYEAGHGVRVGLIESEMLKEYCDCGQFIHAEDGDCACVDEVSAYYFTNMEEWTRTTFLECPEKTWLDDDYSSEGDEDYSEEEDLWDE